VRSPNSFWLRRNAAGSLLSLSLCLLHLASLISVLVWFRFSLSLSVQAHDGLHDRFTHFKEEKTTTQINKQCVFSSMVYLYIALVFMLLVQGHSGFACTILQAQACAFYSPLCSNCRSGEAPYVPVRHLPVPLPHAQPRNFTSCLLVSNHFLCSTF
jgi:hypothetical protein